MRVEQMMTAKSASEVQALAAAFALAGAALRCPERDFARAVASGAFGQAFDDALGELGLEGGCSGLVPEASAEEVFHALRVEATNLFYGMPHAAVSPYESVWVAEAEGRKPLLFVNDTALDVKRAYRAAGLEPEDASQPCDHVATELAFVAQMLFGGEIEAAMGFAERHLGWLDGFASAVKGESPAGFYAPVCAALPELVAKIG